jgi:uncharacterized protein (DUF1778 family)
MAASTKTSRYSVRVSLSDDALFEEAAEVVGESVSKFLTRSGRERAEMVLADRTQFVLDQDVWDAFVAALGRDSEIKPEVLRLFRRPRPE